ncbi:MBL fold metallo-hydrolase, partial [Candidatus Peregrinibacteria bacterium]|nr:MBL fold metallo-hydrolase [Candidatus Peregrinibacteria bacterium]
RIPLLWKRGYRGPVHCTYATKDLAEVMLADSGYIQEKDEEYFCKKLPEEMLPCDGPLYNQMEAIACGELFEGKNYREWFEVVPGVRAKFLDAGHIIGAAMIVLEVEEIYENVGKKSETRNSKSETGSRFPVPGSQPLHIGFSGDRGRNTLPIIRDPEPMEPVEILICESTYGNRQHEDIRTAKGKLKEVLLRTAKRGGKLFIPAFSLERTQEIIYDLHLLWDAKEIPAIPIIVDSPLASRVTDVFMKHPECYDEEMYDQFLKRSHQPFQFSLVTYTESTEESKALNGKPGPMVIMAGSGMCEAGRIRHHLFNGIEDPKNTVLAVGYMAEGTLGRQIIEKDVTEVRIFNRMLRKRAECVYINAYSGHADMADLDPYVQKIPGLQRLILVHGEPSQMDPFAERIRTANPGIEVLMPEREEGVQV